MQAPIRNSARSLIDHATGFSPEFSFIVQRPLSLQSPRVLKRCFNQYNHGIPCRYLSLTRGHLTMSDPTYPLFPVFSFIASILALIPLPWHLQAWNAGTCLYMMWASLSSLVYFVNSIIWHSSMENVASVWCDICKSCTVSI